MLPLLASVLLFGQIGDLELHNRQVLRDCKLGYRTYGTLNEEKSNAILLPSWFGGTSADFDRLVGPGNLFDPASFFLVVVDSLADGVSSSPSNYVPGRPQEFPRVTISDMVEAEYRLVTQNLGLSHLYAVVGISMGGMQTFEWVTTHPNFMTKAVSIVGTPRVSEKEMQLWADDLPLPKPGDATASPSAVWADLIRLGLEKYSKFRHPLNTLRQFEAVQRHDITRNFGGSLSAAAAAVKASMLVVVSAHDKLVYPGVPLSFAKEINADTLELTGPCGHTAFECEKETLGPVVSAFLRR